MSHSRFMEFNSKETELTKAVNSILGVKEWNGNTEHLSSPHNPSTVTENGSVNIPGVGAFPISFSGSRSLMSLFGLNFKTCEKLTDQTLLSMFKELLPQETRNLIFTCGKVEKGGEPLVRAVFRNNRAVLSDTVIFGSLPALLQKSVVYGVWSTESSHAMRLNFKLPSAMEQRLMEFFGAEEVGISLDISNSEVIPESAFVKGSIRLKIPYLSDSIFLIVPKLLPYGKVQNKEHYFKLVNQFAQAAALELNMTSFRNFAAGKQVGLSGMLQGLLVDELLTKKDVFAILKILGFKVGPDTSVDETLREVPLGDISVWELTKAILDHANSLDFYLKRSALEFIPNLWVERK